MGARLDQHFLISERVRDAIVASAQLTKRDRVLEIGPGRGILTSALLARAGGVVAVEMDDRLAAGLPAALGHPADLTMIHADFLTLDLAALGEGLVKVVANLPYAVATPILQRLLLWPHWDEAVLMFQREVAQRIAAAPGSGRYGLLTLSVALRARAELILEAPPQAFSPPPQVSSAVVRLTRLARPMAEGRAEADFFRLARAAFNQRRKMAAGTIASALKLPRERVVAALGACGVSPTSRPQDMPLDAFLRLAADLSK